MPRTGATMSAREFYFRMICAMLAGILIGLSTDDTLLGGGVYFALVALTSGDIKEDEEHIT